jgi:diguanylate cyclase (GGDEF)-like protein/PAS domain S-box-containing protein
VVGAFAFTDLQGRLQLSFPPGVRLQLRDGGRLLLPGGALPEGAGEASLRVGGRTWAASAYAPERAGWAGPLAVGIGGMVVAGLVGLLLAQAGRREDRVQGEVAARTADLARERDRSAGLVASLQDGLVVEDPDGVVLDVNERMCRLVGRAGQEMIGTRPPHPWRAPAEDPLPRDGEQEVTLVHADGRRLTALMSVGDLPPREGLPGARLATFRDITGRKAAERAVRRERDRSRALVASAQDGIAVVDAEGVVVEANPRFCEIVGRRPEGVVGQRAPYPWWPADGECDAAAIYARAQSGGPAGEAEVDLVRPDGRRVWVVVGFAPAGAGGGHVATLTDITERRRAEVTERALRRVATAIARGAEPEEVYGQVAAAAAEVAETGGGAVIRFEPDRSALVLGLHDALPATDALRAVPRFPLVGEAAVPLVARTGRPALVSDLSGLSDPVARRMVAAGHRANAAVPVHVAGRLWGAVGVAGAQPLPPDVVERLLRLADLMGVAIAQAEARSELAARASTDFLTRLANHRSFYEGLRAGVVAARRRGAPLCLALIDIDGFRRVNDIYGHADSDPVLATLAAELAATAREADLVARVGGDEFAWLIPGLDLDEAAALVERARVRVMTTPLPPAGRLTISVGVASLAQAGGDARNLSRLADGALYWAKSSGRNRVVAFDPRVISELTPDDRARRMQRERDLAALRALARAVDAKDPDTLEHSERVAALVQRLARALGWDGEAAGRLREAALVHDVGKIGIPDAILSKPGRLTPAEYVQVRRHAEIGGDIVREVLDEEQSAWVRGHHERWDGTGYPDGAAGDAIPAGARILALADAFDVMTSVRTYKAARSIEDALAECERVAGGQFDPAAVRALRRLWLAGAVGPRGTGGGR